MRELIYYVATTADGFIAHEDGSFDGFTMPDPFGADLHKHFPETLPGPMHETPLTKEDHQLFDAVIMGRKTYQVGLDQGLTSPYPSLDQFVISREMEESPDEEVTLVKENLVYFVEKLKQDEGKDIWLCGGSEIASQLMYAGVIDRLIIKHIPVLFGTGIPLFANKTPITQLTLENRMSYESGHQILFYRI